MLLLYHGRSTGQPATPLGRIRTPTILIQLHHRTATASDTCGWGLQPLLAALPFWLWYVSYAAATIGLPSCEQSSKKSKKIFHQTMDNLQARQSNPEAAPRRRNYDDNLRASTNITDDPRGASRYSLKGLPPKVTPALDTLVLVDNEEIVYFKGFICPRRPSGGRNKLHDLYAKPLSLNKSPKRKRPTLSASMPGSGNAEQCKQGKSLAAPTSCPELHPYDSPVTHAPSTHSPTRAMSLANLAMVNAAAIASGSRVPPFTSSSSKPANERLMPEDSTEKSELTDTSLHVRSEHKPKRIKKANKIKKSKSAASLTTMQATAPAIASGSQASPSISSSSKPASERLMPEDSTEKSELTDTSLHVRSEHKPKKIKKANKMKKSKSAASLTTMQATDACNLEATEAVAPVSVSSEIGSEQLSVENQPTESKESGKEEKKNLQQPSTQSTADRLDSLGPCDAITADLTESSELTGSSSHHSYSETKPPRKSKNRKATRASVSMDPSESSAAENASDSQMECSEVTESSELTDCSLHSQNEPHMATEKTKKAKPKKNPKDRAQVSKRPSRLDAL
jgi:hypothetical protein